MSNILINQVFYLVRYVPTRRPAVAEKLQEILQPKLGRSPFENVAQKHKGCVPKFPIYSGVVDPMVRMLLALYVGCDACPGGVEGMSPNVAYENETYSAAAHSGRALHE
jgi:hypothetical protein